MEASLVSSTQIEQQEGEKKYELRTDLIELIVAETEVLKEQCPNETVELITYVVTSKVLRHPAIRHNTRSMVPEMFVYYLEAYKNYRVRADGPDADPKLLMIEASLGTFDIFLDKPNDATRRFFMSHALEVMLETLIHEKAGDSGEDFSTLMQSFTTLMGIAHRIKHYTAESRRKKNLPFIRWLSALMKKVILTNDPAYTMIEPSVSSVFRQIQQNKSTIVVPAS